MTTLDRLKITAIVFSTITKTPLKTLSSRIFDDGKKLDWIIAGDVDVTTARFDFAMQWFSDNWPEKFCWPPCFYRPKQTSAPK